MRVSLLFVLGLVMILGGCSDGAKIAASPSLVGDPDDNNDPILNGDDKKDEEEEEEVVVEVVTISITPADLLVTRGGMQTFTATVAGAEEKGVTWSVTEVDGGSITDTGNYTAPDLAGVFHVVATSVADTTKIATATVTVTDATRISVSIDPATVEVIVGTTQTFIATVTGSNQGVTWYTTGGSITSLGVLTPPSVEGSISVVATSVADDTKTATATVDVILTPGTVVVNGPLAVSVETNGKVTLSASVAGAKGKQIDWSVTEVDGGTISTTGVYTAPAVAGTYHVVATSKLDATQFATYTITVTEPVIVP